MWWWLGFTAVFGVFAFWCGAVMATGRWWPPRASERRHRKMHRL